MNTGPRFARLRSILWLVVIFLAGGIVGGAVTLTAVRRVAQRAANPARWPVQILERLDRNLELTPEQRTRVEPIVAETAARLRQARREMRREWLAALVDAREALRGELDPGQQEKLEEMTARNRERLQRLMRQPDAGE